MSHTTMLTEKNISDVPVTDSPGGSAAASSNGEVFGHEIDGDEALKAVSDVVTTIDKSSDRRLRRKIDRMMMPV